MSIQEIFDFPKIENLDWRDFIESKENREAFSYLMKWPNWTTNGVIIIGNSGVGKSHLAALWAQSANAVYILQESINHDARDMFKNNCNFILDNFENFLKYQDWLFNFYNIAKEKNRYFIIIDRLPPYLWKISLKDLNSRLLSLPVINIKNPEDELLFKITKKLAQDYGVIISDDTIQYILSTSERQVPIISNLLKILDKLSLQQKKHITTAFVKNYLQKSN